jgi:hypothetical protein
MAKQGWLSSVALAIGASAGCAAAQFGLGYGFGIIEWAPAAGQTITSDKVWLVSLAWTLWIAASSTVIGAVAADRRSLGDIGAAPPRAGTDPTVMATAIWRSLLAVSAAIGALLSIGLVLAPAQLAGRTDTNAPELIASGYVIVGVIAGIVIAVLALAARAAAVNVIATTAWIWILAAASLIYDAANGRTHGSTSIEVWPFGSERYFRDTWSWSGLFVMLTSAAAIGVLAATAAVRRGDRKVGVAVSGGAGPALVMAAYLLTIPTLAGVADPQRSASILAPIALIAGAAGSILVVAAVSSREASLRDRMLRDLRPAGPGELAKGVATTGGTGSEKAPPPKVPAPRPQPANAGRAAAPTKASAPPPSSPPSSPQSNPASPGMADETTTKLPAQGGSNASSGRGNPNPNGPNDKRRRR